MLIRSKIRGVTLIELMIAVVIFGLLLAIGVPAYQSWLHNSQIRTAASSILNGLQLTRAEAVRQNTRVQFQLTDLPMSDWTVTVVGTSAVVQTRSGSEGSRTARVATVSAGTTTVTFSGLGQVVTPNADGSAPPKEVDVTSSIAGATRQLNVLISGGTVRMCDPALSSSNPQSCSY